MIHSTVAFILGGGIGSRLYPLTKERCKPAVPIGGKYRLIDAPISNCLHSGLRRILVLTQFNSAPLNQHIKNTYRFDAFNRGYVDILAADQTPCTCAWFKGSADAVRQFYHYPKLYDSKYVLILSGDQLYQMDYKKLLTTHLESKALVTIATIPVTREEASGLGIMKTDEQGLVTEFIEKPDPGDLDQWKSNVSPEMKEQGREYLASMGIYVFDRIALGGLLNDYPEANDFGGDIIPIIVESGRKVCTLPFKGYWADIKTIRSFFDANLELTDPLPRLDIYDPQKTFYTNLENLPPPKISGTTLHRSILSEGSVIEAGWIERSVIGCWSRIGRDTTITHSIIMGNDYASFTNYPGKTGEAHIPIGVGNGCTINYAIIDKNCRIGHHVSINGGNHLHDHEQEHYVAKDGIIVIPEGNVIPDGSVIPG